MGKNLQLKTKSAFPKNAQKTNRDDTEGWWKLLLRQCTQKIKRFIFSKISKTNILQYIKNKVLFYRMVSGRKNSFLTPAGIVLLPCPAI
jgi:hypothetical protein